MITRSRTKSRRDLINLYMYSLSLAAPLYHYQFIIKTKTKAGISETSVTQI